VDPIHTLGGVIKEIWSRETATISQPRRETSPLTSRARKAYERGGGTKLTHIRMRKRILGVGEQPGRETDEEVKTLAIHLHVPKGGTRGGETVGDAGVH